MLTSVGRWLIALALVIAMSSTAKADTPPADTGVTECANLYLCVGVTDPGSTPAPGQTLGSGSGRSDGIPLCSWNGHQWPCWDNDLGWFDTSDGCYYKAEVPQPPAGAPEWNGHDPATGAVYDVNCRQTDGGLTPRPPMYFATPPGGQPPDNKGDLAAKALAMIGFDNPELHAAPAGTAVVGMPVWLWYKATGKTSGRLTATASGRQISVTLVAQLDHVAWDTDDGTDGVTCAGPGSEYRPGAVPGSGACLYTYHTSSAVKQGKPFALKATLYWNITATASDGTSVPFPPTYKVNTLVPLELKVAEVQALN